MNRTRWNELTSRSSMSKVTWIWSQKIPPVLLLSSWKSKCSLTYQVIWVDISTWHVESNVDFIPQKQPARLPLKSQKTLLRIRWYDFGISFGISCGKSHGFRWPFRMSRGFGAKKRTNPSALVSLETLNTALQCRVVFSLHLSLPSRASAATLLPKSCLENGVWEGEGGGCAAGVLSFSIQALWHPDTIYDRCVPSFATRRRRHRRESHGYRDFYDFFFHCFAFAMSLDVHFSFFATANGIFSSSILSGLLLEFAFPRFGFCCWLQVLGRL